MANATGVICNTFKHSPFGLNKVMVKSTWGWTEGVKFPVLENVSDVFTLGKSVGVTAALTRDYSTITGKFPLEEHVYIYVRIKDTKEEGKIVKSIDLELVTFDKCDIPFDAMIMKLTDISIERGYNRSGILCFVTGVKSPISVDVPVFGRKDFEDGVTFLSVPVREIDPEFAKKIRFVVNDLRSKAIILELIEAPPADKLELRRQDIPICE